MRQQAVTPPEYRRVAQIVEGQATQDGAGVTLTRVMGQPRLPMLDPFLLLDVFESHDPQDYIAGFPAHPHRGFETVTYLLAGRMRHQDNAGHEGVIEPGGVQWMTAGRGIVHSEMPEQEQGRLAGFQLWLNLPAQHKMDPPAYQEYPAERIALEQREPGVQVRVIAGTTANGTRGPVRQPLTDPLFLHVSLQAGRQFSEPVAASHNAFVYVISGVLAQAGPGRADVRVKAGQLVLQGPGDQLVLTAQQDAEFLLVAAWPLHEPVARGGPFVMNSREEIIQAYRDYEQGLMG